jgi:hypothetical protein
MGDPGSEESIPHSKFNVAGLGLRFQESRHFTVMSEDQQAVTLPI